MASSFNQSKSQSQYHITYTYSSLKYFFSFSQWIDFQIGQSLNLSLQSVLSNLQLSQFNIKNLFALFSYLFDREKVKEQEVELKRQNSIKQEAVSKLIRKGSSMNENEENGSQFSSEFNNNSKSVQTVPLSTSFKYNYFTLNQQNIKKVLSNDGLRIIYSQIILTLQRFQLSDSINIDQQMMFKLLINIFYVLIYFIEKENYNEEKKNNINESNTNLKMKGSEFLNRFYKGNQFLNANFLEVQIDNFLIKLLTLSLEAHYIPIKKITMLYTKVLANLFSYQSSNGKEKIFIHPVCIFDDKVIQELPVDNTLDQHYLDRLKAENPPLNQSSKFVKTQPVEQFYRRHNMGECPLAQSIVVGLLRSLLTICNSQNHKKFTTVKGAGVDSFRQWQISYRYAIQNINWVEKLCSEEALQRIKSYQQFDKSTTQKSQPNKSSLIFHQFYVHKIYTTSVITNFFMLILLSLKMNVFIQYLYFLQLISDANGILVLLKFLTDKFQYLQQINSNQYIFVEKHEYETQETIQFKDKVMLTVYSILNMLHSSCNNYPEKVKNYLFEYNSYLIIKKIPVLFFPELKHKKENTSNQVKKKDDAQGSLPNLPSKQELEQLMNKNTTSQDRQIQEAPLVIKNLTQTCYQLLKVQIPYFSKKMKDTNNMKMLIDIYCRFPKKVTPFKRTTLQKLQLKCRSRKHLNNLQKKPIIAIQQMKNIHNEYNNIYYWSNDFLNQLESNRNKQNVQSNGNQKIRTQTDNKVNNKQEHQTMIRGDNINNKFDIDMDYEEWLEENIWRYYD